MKTVLVILILTMLFSIKNINQSERKKLANLKYDMDEMDIYTKATCRKPTADNPFMNDTLADINTDHPAACNDDDENINDIIDEKFNEDLFRDVGDLFNVKNSQRQFYTTIPLVPDSVQFAQWLYGGKKTCKNDQTNCLRYEDPKFIR